MLKCIFCFVFLFARIVFRLSSFFYLFSYSFFFRIPFFHAQFFLIACLVVSFSQQHQRFLFHFFVCCEPIFHFNAIKIRKWTFAFAMAQSSSFFRVLFFFLRERERESKKMLMKELKELNFFYATSPISFLQFSTFVFMLIDIFVDVLLMHNDFFQTKNENKINRMREKKNNITHSIHSK